MSATANPSGPVQHKVQVELWSDLTWPWSYLAKHRWERAVQRFEHPSEVLVRHRSWQSDPSRAPGDHVGALTWLTERYAESPPGASGSTEQVVTEALDEGLSVDLERAVHTSTLDAHRLCHLGLDQGGPAQQAAVLERLFAAHFAEGKALDDADVLQRLGAEAGLDEVQVAGVLAGDDYRAAVREDELLAARRGLSTPPGAVVNGDLLVEGVPSVDTMLGRLQEAWHALDATGQAGVGSVSSSN